MIQYLTIGAGLLTIPLTFYQGGNSFLFQRSEFNCMISGKWAAQWQQGYS